MERKQPGRWRAALGYRIQYRKRKGTHAAAWPGYICPQWVRDSPLMSLLDLDPAPTHFPPNGLWSRQYAIQREGFWPTHGMIPSVIS